jgi:hypothetical protein
MTLCMGTGREPLDEELFVQDNRVGIVDSDFWAEGLV